MKFFVLLMFSVFNIFFLTHLGFAQTINSSSGNTSDQLISAWNEVEAKACIENINKCLNDQKQIPLDLFEQMERFGKQGVPLVADLMDKIPMKEWQQFLPYFKEMGWDAQAVFPVVRKHYFEATFPDFAGYEGERRNSLNEILVNLGEPGLNFLAEVLGSPDPLVDQDKILKNSIDTSKADSEQIKAIVEMLRLALAGILRLAGPFDSKFYPAPNNKDHYVWGEGDWRPIPPYLQELFQNKDPEVNRHVKGLMILASGVDNYGQFVKQNLDEVVEVAPLPVLTSVEIKKQTNELKKAWKGLGSEFYDSMEGNEGCKSCELLVRYWPTSKPFLLKALKKTEGNYCENALEALINLRPLDPDFVPVLSDLLKNENKNISVQAAFVLGQMGPMAASALPEFDQLLTNLYVPHDFHRDIPRDIDRVLESLTKLGPQSIPLLVKYGENYEYRLQVCSGLIRVVTPEWKKAIPYLKEMTQDRRLEVRRWAWLALRNIESGNI